MFRTIRNIFTLILIGIIASGMPIYANSINLNAINLSALMPNIISKKDVIIVTTEENIISSNHIQIKYGFSTDPSTDYLPLLFNENIPFTVELTSNNEQVQDLSLDDLVSLGNYKSIQLYGDAPVYIIFDFNQEKLNLPDGSYNLKIIPNLDNKELVIEDSEFEINFNTEGNYVPALPATGGITALTLYFPDNEFNNLLPITRFVKNTEYPLTTTLRNLEQGPHKDLGLATESPIPVGGSAGKDRDTAHVRLPKDISAYDQGSSKAIMAINSFVRSLTSNSGISKVQFHLTGQYSNEPFHGMDMDEPFFPPNGPEIYTAYITDTNRFLLAPISFGMFGNQYSDNNIETIFNTMKFKTAFQIYNAKRHPIVPNEVELVGYNINNGMLTLTFNEEFTKVYENNPERHQMMVDGIIFTFTSLENVNSVNIKVQLGSKDSNSQEIINYDFEPPVYINPES